MSYEEWGSIACLDTSDTPKRPPTTAYARSGAVIVALTTFATLQHVDWLLFVRLWKGDSYLIFEESYYISCFYPSALCHTVQLTADPDLKMTITCPRSCLLDESQMSIPYTLRPGCQISNMHGCKASIEA